MKSFIRGFRGKALKQTADAAASAVVSGGDEVVSAARAGWKASGKELAEGAGKHVDDIMEDLSGVRAIGSKVSKEISDNVNTANKGLSDAVTKLDSSTRARASELDRIHRNIMKKEELEPGKQVKSVLDAMKQRRAELDGQVKLQTKQLEELSKVLETSIKPGHSAAALRMFDTSAVEGINSVPGVLMWKSGLNNALMRNKQILGMTSKNLNNNTRFLKEYLALKRNPTAVGKLDAWTANPQNFKKLETLMRRDAVFDIVQKGKIGLKRRIIGYEPAETAKRLGLGAAVATTGAIGMYHWFGNNDPAMISGNSKTAEASVRSIRSSGDGGEILAKARASLNEIDAISAEADKKLSTDGAPEATSMFVTKVGAELAVIIGALDEWDVVVQNSDDKEGAEIVRKKLWVYVKKLTTGLETLSKQLGVSITEPGIAGKTSPTGVTSGVNKDNLMKVQGFLRLNGSGTLDRPTIKALRDLEYQFNKRAGTDQFTGIFVVPEVGHVVSYDNLVIAYQKIQKYKDTALT